jgi:hypothetical protein
MAGKDRQYAMGDADWIDDLAGNDLLVHRI